jgi:uncharacterized protein
MEENITTRRSFIGKALAASAAALLASRFFQASAGKPAREYGQEPSLLGKKLLFVHGGWPGHDPELNRDLFVPWMRSEGADVTVSDSLDSYLDKELMDSLDLVVQIWTMGTINNEQEKGLIEAVKNGCGLAGWHGGLCDLSAITWSTSS